MYIIDCCLYIFQDGYGITYLYNRIRDSVTMQEIAACVTDHMLPISRAINKLLASHSMPLTNGYLIIIYELPVFLKSQVPVVEMQKGV